jgi:hypothetical protein
MHLIPPLVDWRRIDGPPAARVQFIDFVHCRMFGRHSVNIAVSWNKKDLGSCGCGRTVDDDARACDWTAALSYDDLSC